MYSVVGVAVVVIVASVVGSTVVQSLDAVLDQQ
jgi:hypothetical protein